MPWTSSWVSLPSSLVCHPRWSTGLPCDKVRLLVHKAAHNHAHVDSLLRQTPSGKMTTMVPGTRIGRVLVTGAAGALGSTVRASLAGRYELVRCTDIVEMAPPGSGEQVVVADLGDLSALRELTRGIDAVIHFGGETSDTTWERIHHANVLGTANVFGAASENEVKRVIFASTNHVVGFHPVTDRLDDSTPVRPDTVYAASKVFGEAIGHVYSAKTGMRVLCLRIGTCSERPMDSRSLATWLSYGDLVQLVSIGLTAEYEFETVYGVSANTRRRWDDPVAERLGYQPVDNAELYADEVSRSPDGDDDYHGGSFVRVPIAGPQ